MYKLNGLKPINFSTPPMSDFILQSCREVFQGTSSTVKETDKTTENKETLGQTETDDMTLRLEDENSAKKEEKIKLMLKRQRK